MSKKLKFKPELTRIQLDPEQAILYCSCYDGSGRSGLRPATSGTGCSICGEGRGTVPMSPFCPYESARS